MAILHQYEGDVRLVAELGLKGPLSGRQCSLAAELLEVSRVKFSERIEGMPTNFHSTVLLTFIQLCC